MNDKERVNFEYQMHDLAAKIARQKRLERRVNIIGWTAMIVTPPLVTWIFT